MDTFPENDKKNARHTTLLQLFFTNGRDPPWLSVTLLIYKRMENYLISSHMLTFSQQP